MHSILTFVGAVRRVAVNGGVSAGTRIWPWRRFPAHYLVFFGLIVVLASCTIVKTGPPTTEETRAIQASQEGLVLLRIIGEVNGEPFIPCWGGICNEPGVVFALANFDTGGEFQLAFPRFLNTATRKEGWLFFILTPGTHYLAMQAGRIEIARLETITRLARAWPRVQIEVPADTSLVYGGTVHLQCSGINRTKLQGLMGQWLSDVCSVMRVQNDESLARQVVSDHASHFGLPKTVLIQRPDTDTIILRRYKKSP